MKQYLWKARPLLVFSPDESGELAMQRQNLDAGRTGIVERDMVVVEIIGDRVATLTGPACQEIAADLRAFADVSNGDFRVVLVGKDGGIKLTSQTPVAMAPLFALIDSMPMRQQEIDAEKTMP